MKNKYKATSKTYASQPRRNGKVTARLAGLLARADVHVEEGELKSISTGSEPRALSIYANGGVVGAPRWVNGGETLHLEGTGRVFIGNAEDPNNLREVGVARNVTVDFARGRDRTVLAEVDYAGLEVRILNYGVQAAVADDIARQMDREIMNSILFNQRYSHSPNPADTLTELANAANAPAPSLEEFREVYQRFSEVAGFFAVPNFSIGVEHPSRRKKKKDRKPHPQSGKVVVRRKTRRTLLGIVVTDMRVASGGVKRTAQLGITVQAPRRRRYGNK